CILQRCPTLIKCFAKGIGSEKVQSTCHASAKGRLKRVVTRGTEICPGVWALHSSTRTVVLRERPQHLSDSPGEVSKRQLNSWKLRLRLGQGRRALCCAKQIAERQVFRVYLIRIDAYSSLHAIEMARCSVVTQGQ